MPLKTPSQDSQEGSQKLPLHSSYQSSSDPSLPVTFSQAGPFQLFPKLPEAARLNIWRHAASVPRVVEVFETHGGMPPKAEGEDPVPATVMQSRTRPPAILSVCRESRNLALTIYTDMGDGIRTNEYKSYLGAPVYVNPEVDIVYRGKSALDKGDAFRIRCKDWLHSEPIAATGTLAVDLAALTPRIDIGSYQLLELLQDNKKEENDELAELAVDNPWHVVSVAAWAMILLRQIAQCALKGVREIIFVVGNYDGIAEFSLVPLERDPALQSSLKTGAYLAVENLRESLDTYWKEKGEEGGSILKTVPPPNLKLMTVKRSPLKYFTSFPKLPVEIQDMVWHYVLQTPRVLTLTHTHEKNNHYLTTTRPPPLMSVCRASRAFVKARLDQYRTLSTTCRHTSYKFYNPEIDIVHIKLTGGSTFRDFNRYNIKSLGIPWNNHTWRFSGREAKTFVGLREIVLLIGTPRADCEITPIDISETLPELELMKRPPMLSPFMWSPGPKELLKRIRANLASTSKKWKSYQARRAKIGRSSPDWVMPTVRLAYMKEICETESPYSY